MPTTDHLTSAKRILMQLTLGEVEDENGHPPRDGRIERTVVRVAGRAAARNGTREPTAVLRPPVVPRARADCDPFYWG
jgi:hypothetical protein